MITNRELKLAIDNFLEREATDLIERHPENYFVGTTDYGYINNGVGWSCCGEEDVYDECKAYEDATDELIEDLNFSAGVKGCLNNGVLDSFIEIPEICEVLKMIVLGKLKLPEQKPEPETARQLATNFFNNLMGVK